jgi:hypothetical protein
MNAAEGLMISPNARPARSRGGVGLLGECDASSKATEGTLHAIGSAPQNRLARTLSLHSYLPVGHRK